MIYITGDTHGLIDFSKLKTYFGQRYASDRDFLIILGDAGLLWSEEDCYIGQYSQLGPTVLFIDGNHENFDLLNRFPVVTRFGAKVHYLDRKVYHVLRGEVLTILGKTFLCLGGATSIDRAYRIPGLSWWPQEHIEPIEVERALANALPLGNKVDYVLTHCAPSSIVIDMFSYRSDSDTKMLEVIRSNISFDHWFFGHYHKDKRKGRFRCFYNDILEIPLLDKGTRCFKRHLLVLEDDEPSGKLRNWHSHSLLSARPSDLPEWFYEHYSYRWWYYDMKDAVDVAYIGSPFDNHISKDSRVYVAFDKKHPKTKDHRPKIEKEWEYSTWRANVVDFVLGLEKYSPRLSLTPIKAQINLTYDQYLNNPSNIERGQKVEARPFPNIPTPRYQDRWTKEKAHYLVRQGEKTLATFLSRETAIVYAETYVLHNLGCGSLHHEEEEGPFFHRFYKVGIDKTAWVVVEEFGEEKA